MAIFVFFAWCCELAEKVGIIAEDMSPAAQAYREANHCLHLLKQELHAQEVLEVTADSVRRADGVVVACVNHRVVCNDRELSDLGAGEVVFRARDDHTVEARIRCTHEEAQHEVTVYIPVKGGIEQHVQPR